MLLIIPRRPRRNDHERPECYQHSPPQVTPQKQPGAEHDQEEHVHGPGERGQTTENATGQAKPARVLWAPDYGLQAREKLSPESIARSP